MTRSAAPWVLRVVIAAGLSIDAYVHLHLAPRYDVVVATISEARCSGRQAAITAVAALPVSTYVHMGEVGPFPDMYEPTWFAEMRLAVLAESAAALAAICGLLLRTRSAQVAHPGHEHQRR